VSQPWLHHAINHIGWIPFTSHVDHTAVLITVYVSELLYSTLINLSLVIRVVPGKEERK